MNYCLLFIYNRENKIKEVITEIQKLLNHKYFDFEQIKIDKKNIKYYIYSSEFSGLGKSTKIKNNLKKRKKIKKKYNYIYFPL